MEQTAQNTRIWWRVTLLYINFNIYMCHCILMNMIETLRANEYNCELIWVLLNVWVKFIQSILIQMKVKHLLRIWNTCLRPRLSSWLSYKAVTKNLFPGRKLFFPLPFLPFLPSLSLAFLLSPLFSFAANPIHLSIWESVVNSLNAVEGGFPAANAFFLVYVDSENVFSGCKCRLFLLNKICQLKQMWLCRICTVCYGVFMFKFYVTFLLDFISDPKHSPPSYGLVS